MRPSSSMKQVSSFVFIRHCVRLSLLALSAPNAEKPRHVSAVVAHMGLTTAGSIGAKTALTLDQSVKRVQAISDAARDVNPDVLVLCHGGKPYARHSEPFFHLDYGLVYISRIAEVLPGYIVC
jgi:predicted TIM-barrel enzyme